MCRSNDIKGRDVSNILIIGQIDGQIRRLTARYLKYLAIRAARRVFAAESTWANGVTRAFLKAS